MSVRSILFVLLIAGWLVSFISVFHADTEVEQAKYQILCAINSIGIILHVGIWASKEDDE